MQDEIGRELSQYRISRAADDLESAKIMLDAGKANAAANRAYYAIFHSMRAVFALDRKDYSKHSAVISFFSKDYILTGHFDKEYSKTIKLAEMLRSTGDYADYQDASHDEAEEVIQRALKFYAAVKTYIDNRISNN